MPGIDNQEITEIHVAVPSWTSKDALSKARPGEWEYDIVYPAYKCNMTDIMAALGLAQYNRYHELLDRRRQIIRMYDEGLKGCNIQILNHFKKDYVSNGHLYMIRLLGRDESYRNTIIKKWLKRYSNKCSL